MFYNTTNTVDPELSKHRDITGKQEKFIYRLFQKYNCLTTDQVFQKIKAMKEERGETLNERAIISIRRAVTDLFNAGLIEKTELKKRASSGRMNHVYKICK